MKVIVFMGTRPEAIKMAPVVKMLQASPGCDTVIVATGQHREMLQQVVDLFELNVDYDLAVMQPNQTLASLTARLMTVIDELLDRVKPNMALVQGDTTTVLVAALACFYRRIPLGHVEAGLRTGDIYAPFPEEANRTLASKLVALHFAPTTTARDNLLREGVAETSVSVTGNTVIDALQNEVARQQDPELRCQIHRQLSVEIAPDWDQVPFVLVTGHRRENFGEGFAQITEALATLAEQFPAHRFIYPVHLNPNVQKPVFARLGTLPNVKLIPPKDYRLFVALMTACTLVLTDSGGVQEEAPGLGKPVLVMRDTTERPEGLAAGTVRLVGANSSRIVAEVTKLLTDPAAYRAMSEAINPYGDGRASERIVERIRRFLTDTSDGRTVR